MSLTANSLVRQLYKLLQCVYFTYVIDFYNLLVVKASKRGCEIGKSIKTEFMNRFRTISKIDPKIIVNSLNIFNGIDNFLSPILRYILLL